MIGEFQQSIALYSGEKSPERITGHVKADRLAGNAGEKLWR